ncbi:MAG: hypothetical protein A4E61_00159 [Syntrophorhabdus sp. PtaB.Bin184]|nr:MAG: hypothetical protein A4E61_00159 [Syntrophorhabdus sp. PtaB.Bin184]
MAFLCREDRVKTASPLVRKVLYKWDYGPLGCHVRFAHPETRCMRSSNRVSLDVELIEIAGFGGGRLLLRPRGQLLQPRLEALHRHRNDIAQTLPPRFIVGKVGCPGLFHGVVPQHDLMFVEFARLWVVLIDHEHLRACRVGTYEDVHLVPVLAFGPTDVPVMCLKLGFPLLSILGDAPADGSLGVLDADIKALNRNVPFLVVVCLDLRLRRLWKTVLRRRSRLARGLVDLLLRDPSLKRSARVPQGKVVSVGGDDSPGGDIGVEKKRCDALRPVVVLSQ